MDASLSTLGPANGGFRQSAVIHSMREWILEFAQKVTQDPVIFLRIVFDEDSQRGQFPVLGLQFISTGHSWVINDLYACAVPQLVDETPVGVALWLERRDILRGSVSRIL